MTRKITLSIILILLMIVCYEVAFGKNETIRKVVPSVSQLSKASDELNKSSAILESKTTTEYEAKRKQLTTSITNYNQSKQEYDEIVPTTANENVLGIAENELKDIYDVSFLWTTIGNYATEEGVAIDMVVQKNTTSASAIRNSATSDYIVCDLKFTLTGKYINLTDFIFDLEDDDRLGFEINDFDMQKSGEDLQVTLTVKEIKINGADLIETPVIPQIQSEDSSDTQTVNSNTTNTSKATNTTNTKNKVN